MSIHHRHRTRRREHTRWQDSPDAVLLSIRELALLLDDEDVEFVKFLKSLYAMIGFDPEADPTTGS